MHKKTLTAIAVILMIAGTFLYFNNISANTSEVTVSGEVIDVSCYLGSGKDGIGKDHLDCAIMCAKAGSALGILTSSGDVYFPVGPMGKNNNEKLLDYVGNKVEVTGTKLNQGNLLGIKIASIKKTE